MDTCSIPSAAALITAGDPRRLTGGNIYNRYILEAMHCAGLSAVQVVLPLDQSASAGCMLKEKLLEQQPVLVMVDSIAIDAAAPFAAWIRETLGAQLLALMYMVPSDLAAVPRRDTLRRLEYQLLSLADHVVALSDCIAQSLVEAGAAPERTTVIAPGKDGVPVVAASLESEDRPRFLCVANWSPSKCIHTLVEALAWLPPSARLDLVGDHVDSSYAAYVRQLIHWNMLEDRVKVWGPLQGEALARLFAAADVFVLPSASETFGIVYAEAMSFGLPVIACSAGPLSWLIQQDCGILVPREDPGALAGAMQAIVADSSLLQRMGEAARRRAASLPTWNQSTQQFCRLIFDLLQGRERQATQNRLLP